MAFLDVNTGRRVLGPPANLRGYQPAPNNLGFVTAIASLATAAYGAYAEHRASGDDGGPSYIGLANKIKQGMPLSPANKARLDTGMSKKGKPWEQTPAFTRDGMSLDQARKMAQEKGLWAPSAATTAITGHDTTTTYGKPANLGAGFFGGLGAPGGSATPILLLGVGLLAFMAFRKK
jgi:hypothetical protein